MALAAVIAASAVVLSPAAMPSTQVFTESAAIGEQMKKAQPSVDSRYLPVKGAAWRLCLADVNGDGRDEVFFHPVRMDGGAYRIYAIDPGWLDPCERQVAMRIQMPGTWKVRDLLTGGELAVRKGVVRFTVPAGSLRVLEARPGSN